MSNHKSPLAVLMMAAFVDTLGAFLVLALLPFYAETLGATALQVGALVSSFAVAQLLSAPLWGRLSDRRGRRQVILFGLVLQVAAFGAFALASSLPWLLLCRLAQGLGGGTVSVVFASIAESSAPSERAQRIGWLTAATSGAAMIGPAIGSWASRFGPSWPGWIAAALTAAALVLVWRWLPETRSSRVPASKASLGGAAFAVLRRPLRLSHFLIWTYAVGMFATNGALAIIGLFLFRRFGIAEDEIWWFFLVLAGASMVWRLWVLPFTLRGMGEVRTLLLGAAVLGGGLVAMSWSASLLWMLLPVVAMAAGQSWLYPATTGLLSRVVRPRRLGLMMGVQQAFGGAARVVGPLAAGWMFGNWGGASPLLALGVLAMLWSLVAASRLGRLRSPARRRRPAAVN